jgi:hypothetical protein
MNRLKESLKKFPLALTPELIRIGIWSRGEAFLYVEETLCVATGISNIASHHLLCMHILNPECLTSLSQVQLSPNFL